jgi:hypothetical protein
MSRTMVISGIPFMGKVYAAAGRLLSHIAQQAHRPQISGAVQAKDGLSGDPARIAVIRTQPRILVLSG